MYAFSIYRLKHFNWTAKLVARICIFFLNFYRPKTHWNVNTTRTAHAPENQWNSYRSVHWQIPLLAGEFHSERTRIKSDSFSVRVNRPNTAFLWTFIIYSLWFCIYLLTYLSGYSCAVCKDMDLMCTEAEAPRRAYEDPVLIQDSRVLQNMLALEDRYQPNPNYFKCVQTEIKRYMRKMVAQWMLEV